MTRNDFFQMEKYRKSSSASSAEEMQTSRAQFAPPLDGWQDFLADFETDLNDGKATFSHKAAAVQQTVEEEYSTYVMGAPSSGTMLDTLKFWQVSSTNIFEAVACRI